MKKILALLICLILVGCGSNEDLTTIDLEKTKAIITVDKDNNPATCNDIVFRLRKTKAGVIYGLEIVSEDEHSIKVQFNVVVRLMKKNVRPAFVFEKEAK